MQYRNADRPLDYNPLQRTPSLYMSGREIMATLVLVFAFTIVCVLVAS